MKDTLETLIGSSIPLPEVEDDLEKDLESTAVKLDSFASRYFLDHHQILLTMAHEIKQLALQEFSSQNMKLQKTAELIQLHSLKIFDGAKQKLNFFKDKVSILYPKNILQRGYSITIKNGKALKSIDDIRIDDEITTILVKGKVLSLVTRKE